MSKTITRRQALATGLAGVTAAGVLGETSRAWSDGVAQTVAAERQRPLNVLFINSDQQRSDALSCAGASKVATPNLDRLARDGVRFTSAYTPSPVCVPARAAFHSGLSTHVSGCITLPNDPGLQFRNGTFEQNLVKLGYRAEYHGRWHAPLELTNCYANEVTLNFIRPYRKHLAEKFGKPLEPGPGQFVEEIGGWPYTPDAADFSLRASRNNPPPHGIRGVRYGIEDSPAAHTFTAFVADETIAALQRNKDRPFCISAGILSPHHPMTVTADFAKRIDPSKMDTPATIHDQRLNTPYVSWVWQMDDTDKAAVAVMQARYYALVEEVDHHVGRVLNALDQLGLADNTLVIFISDHGELMGDHGVVQKFLPYRESVCVPMILRLPGKIPAGTVVPNVVNTRDLFATIFDYAGHSCPEQHGHSVRPLVEGRAGYPEFTVSEYGRGPGGYLLIATRDWKYIWTANRDSPDLLFDLNQDPRELNNLLGSHPKRLDYLKPANKLRDDLLGWMSQIRHPQLDAVAKSKPS